MNSFAPIDPSLVDQFPSDGYPDELAAGDTPDVLWDACGSASRAFPKSLWIEPKDWAAKASENDKHKTWAMNYIDRFTNQAPTDECTNHSHTRATEAARNRQRGVIFRDGPKKDFRYPESSEYGSVWFSAMWPYNKANPNIRGGAAIRTILEHSCQYGMMPDKIQPREYGFRHTMPGTMGGGNGNQSSGSWVSVRNMPEGWEETARWFKPIEVIFPDTWEQAVCLVLHGMFCCVGYNGHAFPPGQCIFNGDTLESLAYPDSYNVIRYISRRAFQVAYRGSYSVATMTTPDDWMKPAG